MSEAKSSHNEIFLLKFLVGISLMGAFIVWVMVQQFRQQTTTQTGRTVASITAHEVAVSLMLSCKNKNEWTETKANVVRFVVEDCAPFANTQSPWILTNKTNGFSATWFELSRGHRSSDFMDLKIGANEFEWKVQDTLGQEQKFAFTVNRVTNQ